MGRCPRVRRRAGTEGRNLLYDPCIYRKVRYIEVVARDDPGPKMEPEDDQDPRPTTKAEDDAMAADFHRFWTEEDRKEAEAKAQAKAAAQANAEDGEAPDAE